MANDEDKHKKKSSSSVCEMSMLLVSNIIRLSSRRLFATHSFTPSNNIPPQTQDHERIQESESTIITKPRSYLVKPGQVPQTLTRHEINDVDANADNYISQVREKINGNHAKTAPSGTAAGAASFSGAISSSSSIVK